MKRETFLCGQQVLYIPDHANGNQGHKDCEYGIVKKDHGAHVFVHYIRNRMLQYTAERTSWENLKKMSDECFVFHPSVDE